MGLFTLLKKDEKVKKDEKLSKEETEDRQEVVDFIKKQYEGHPLKGEEQLRRAYYKAWVDGNHYMRIDTTANKLTKETSSTKNLKHRSKINYMRKNRNIAVAKVMKDQPVLNCIPMGGTIRDIKAARVGKAIFENAFAQNEINLTGKCFNTLKIAYSMCTGWWKIGWNPLLLGGKGNYQVTVHDDFEIYPDPSATDWWSMDWCIHAYLQDVVKIERLYPKLKGKIKEWHNNENTQNRNLYTLDYYTNNPKTYQGKAFVLEFVARPGGRWDKGKKVILLNFELVAKYGDNPFAKFGEFFSMNFVPFVWEEENGQIHGVAGVPDQIPINKEINKICSMTMENIKKTAAMKVLLPRGSSKAEDWISDKVHVGYYNADGGGKPIFPNPPSMPSYVPNHLTYLVGTQQDMAGIHEVSMGQLPERGSQMSGSALKLLQDSEQVQQSPVMRSLKTSLTIAGQLILKIAQEYYTEPRLISICGQNKRHEIVEFMGADLDGSFDIKLEIGSAFNTSAAAKVEGLLSLWKEGIIQEAEKGSKAARKVLAALEFGQVDEIYQLESIQEAKAQWVLTQTLINHKDPMSMISDWENHGIYIQVLQEFMLTPDFQEETDEIKNILNTQMQYHMKMKGSGNAGPTQPPTPGGAEAGPAVPSMNVDPNMMLAEGSNMSGGGEMPMGEGDVNA